MQLPTWTVQPAPLWTHSRVHIHELAQEVQGRDPWYSPNIVVSRILILAAGWQMTLLCQMLNVLLQLQLLLRI